MEESCQVFNSVFKKVLSLKEQLCSCTSYEYMIAPDQVSTAHTIEVCERTLYLMEDVAVAVLTKTTKITDTNGIALDAKRLLEITIHFFTLLLWSQKHCSIQIMLSYQFKMIIFSTFKMSVVTHFYHLLNVHTSL